MIVLNESCCLCAVEYDHWLLFIGMENEIAGGPGGGTGDVLIIFHCYGDV